MRRVACLVSLVLLLSSDPASAQSVGVHASAGPTLGETGYTVAAGVSLSPASYLALVINAERTHLPSRVTRGVRSISTFRGATLTLGTVELRGIAFGRRRFRPFGVVGLGAGQASPDGPERFSGEGLSEGVRAVFCGGGIEASVRPHLSILAEFRVMLVGETNGEGLLGAGPLRAGVAWRF